MKSFLETILFFLSLNICWVLADKNAQGGLDFKDTIEKFLEDLHLKIPQVFNFPDQNFVIPSNRFVDGTANFSNISFTGLKEFNATIVYHNILQLPKAFTILFENLVLNMDYTSNISMYSSEYIKLFGEGTASVHLRNMIFGGDISISILPMNASITANIDMDGVLVNITGLLDNDEFSEEFGTFLSKSASKIFRASKNALSKIISNTLNTLIQSAIAHYQVNHQLTEEKRVFRENNLIPIFQYFLNSGHFA